ncbi:MAG: hypothetical protein KDA75_07360, partial [Planctomycetaceae bacterium]|nr:hypothetical protein [Planctomycetaceae bacterium]
MGGSRIRLLLLTTAAVCLCNLALTGRSRSRTTIQPRTVESDQQSPSVNATAPGSGAAPTVFNRFSQQEREQETTIRPRTTTPVAPSQVRAVAPVDKDQLVAVVEEAITKTSRRYLDVEEYTPWQMMHGVLALRGDYQVRKNGQLINGVQYISSGPIFRGDYWWEKTSFGGRGHPYSVPYHFEGHINQFPALLCMAALPLDHQLVAKGGTITVGDIVQNAQRTVNSSEEISWTLWLLTQYISQDAQWVNAQGQQWSMESLVRLQVTDGVDDAPCGGTHGLFALAFSRNAYLRQHGQLRGIWVNSEYKLRKHIELARQLQNPDGSFSTNWFKGRGFTYDFKERIKTSGHMLEWLMMALPASRLDEAWVRRAIQSVANDLIRNATAPAECGPMYHALHALVLYRERVAPPKSVTPPAELAAAPAAKPVPTRPETTAAPKVEPQRSGPTRPEMLPPEPAQAKAGAAPRTPAAVRDDVPKIQGAAPLEMGIARISPAAPATTSPGNSRVKVSAPTPSPAQTASVDPSAPAMLARTEARPLTTSPADPPANGTTPAAAPPAPKPLLVLQQPIGESRKNTSREPMAESTPSTPAEVSHPKSVAATPLPTDLPPAIADAKRPADLPPAMAHAEQPADLPPAMSAVEPA